MKLFHLTLISLLISSVALLNTGCDKFSKDDKANNTLSSAKKTEVEQQIHDYLLSHPEILIEMSKKLQDKLQQEQTQKTIQLIKANTDALFKNTTSPIAGNENGTVTVVEFFDYQCLHCAEMFPVLQKIMAANPNVRVIFKETPIFGGVSDYAASAALASIKQGQYLAMHDALFNASNSETKMSPAKVDAIAKKIGLDLIRLKQDMKADTVKEELKANLLLAQQLQLQGTPVIIVIPAEVNSSPDSKISFIPGSVSADSLQKAVDQAK